MNFTLSCKSTPPAASSLLILQLVDYRICRSTHSTCTITVVSWHLECLGQSTAEGLNSRNDAAFEPGLDVMIGHEGLSPQKSGT